MKRITLLLFISVVFVTNLFAWGAQGHRIVAAVAYDNLTCKARHHVDKVLGTRGIIYYSTWPDDIKSDTIYPTSGDWHYQDLDANMSDSALMATLTHYPTKGGNLFRVTDSLINVLQHDNTQQDALKFIVHFVADRFCPMHIAHMDDHGGNRVKMKWFGQNTNLHSVWDAKIIEYNKYSYSEYATYLEDTFGDEKKEIKKLSREDELRYNYQLVDSIYQYQQTWSGNTYHYAYHWSYLMNRQLYMAGIKLSMLLNNLY